MKDHGRMTILYIDDEQINTFLFKSIFKRHYEVITGLSAREGLEHLKNYKSGIDIVISDFLMPEMNGIEFIRIAKSKFPTVKYFILSAYEKNQEISEALESKLIEDYFSKPLKAKEIEAVLTQTIR